MKHSFDEDGICRHCGFDGAEWWYWKNSTFEGIASDDAKIPSCQRTYYTVNEIKEILTKGKQNEHQ